MEDIVKYLRRQRPYIQPMILNRDTGEKIWMEEISTKVQKGYDPKLLTKSPRRFDLGAVISEPAAPFIPRWISPNQITVANQVLAWGLFGLAFAFACSNPDQDQREPECGGPLALIWNSLSALDRVCLLAVLSLGNIINMMMDCLDGIHARKTNQCSKFGEVLDHWFDAMTTPLLASVSCMIIQPSKLLQIIMLILIPLLYNAQLIFYHYERVFLHTAGVEGQVLMSVIFLAWAILVSTPSAAPYITMVADIVALIVSASTIHLDWFYVQRFKERGMLLEHMLYLAVCCTVGGLYYTNFLTQISFMMIILTTSFRINGSYVICSVINYVYRGFDARLLEYVILMLIAHYVMAPIPLTLFYHNLVPYIGSTNVTLQDVLPSIICIDLILRNMFDLQSSTKALIAKDQADRAEALLVTDPQQIHSVLRAQVDKKVEKQS